MIDAHVVPDNVLFLGPTNEGDTFRTLVFTDMLKVNAFFTKTEEGDKTKCMICVELFYFYFNNTFLLVMKQIKTEFLSGYISRSF